MIIVEPEHLENEHKVAVPNNFAVQTTNVTIESWQRQCSKEFWTTFSHSRCASQRGFAATSVAIDQSLSSRRMHVGLQCLECVDQEQRLKSPLSLTKQAEDIATICQKSSPFESMTF